MLQVRASGGSPRVAGDGPRPRRPHTQSGGSRVIRPQYRGQQRLWPPPGSTTRPRRPPAPVPPQVPGASSESVPRRRPPALHQPRPPRGPQAASTEEPRPDVLRSRPPEAVCLGVTAPAAGAASAPVHHELPVQPRDLCACSAASAFPWSASPSHAPHQSVQLTVQSPSPGAARHNQLEGLLPVLVRNKIPLMLFVSIVVTRSPRARARSDLNKLSPSNFELNVCP